MMLNLVRCMFASMLLYAASAAVQPTRIDLIYDPSILVPGLVTRMRAARVRENVAGYLERFAPSRGLSMRLRECGQPNAMFLPARTEIVLCTELVKDIMARQDEDADARARSLLSGGTLLWVATYEFGHALIQMHRCAAGRCWAGKKMPPT